MQKLLEEINKKRKLSEELHRNSEEKIGTTKYIRQSDVRRIELEKKIATQEAIDLERRRHVEKTADNLNDPKFHVELNNPYEELLKLTEDEIKMRLRTLGKPITLFGEDFVERARRLHKIQNEDLQDDEYRLGAAHNNISENLSGHTALPGTLHLEKNKSNNKNDDDDDDDENENEGPDESNKKGPGTILTNFSHTPGLTPEKIVYKYFRNLNKQWEWDLSLREEAEKLCAKGKLETRTQKQCKDYIRPLFKLCKKGEVPLDILSKLVTVSYYFIYILLCIYLYCLSAHVLCCEHVTSFVMN